MIDLLMTRATWFTERGSWVHLTEKPSGSSQNSQLVCSLWLEKLGDGHPVGTSGVGAAETEGSVALGRPGKRERWDSRRSFTPDKLTLSAMHTRIKLYNVLNGTRYRLVAL